MRIENLLSEKVIEAIKNLYEQSISPNQITFQKTKQEFEGDITLLVFPLTKVSKKSPEETANKIGEYLKQNVSEVKAFNVVKGFLNLVIADSYWINYLAVDQTTNNEQRTTVSETVMVEFSSPNTNKPLHLGHIRNNLLGSSISEILKASGRKVIRVNLVNDRGIHICKSMIAWLLIGHGETPDTSGMKGDHLVGKYYVEFDKIYKDQVENSQIAANKIILALSDQRKSTTFLEEEFKQKATDKILEILLYIRLNNFRKQNRIDFDIPSMEQLSTIGTYENLIKRLDEPERNMVVLYRKEFLKKIEPLSFEKIDTPQFKEQLLKIFEDFTPIVYDTHHLLRLWEEGDKATIELWKKMNGWVYDGFAVTYKNLGVEFEKTYYESETYLLGKKIVEEGLEKKVFERRNDNSVWIDLTKDGLDEKLLLRSDGTSVYITQDLGTAIERQKEFHFNRLVYVVGNEQEYHFKVLFLILKKLGYDWAQNLFHLSYGMVDLPSGKMKSREGTVVDADDLIDEMIHTAKAKTQELGKADELSSDEAEKLYKMIGLAALKYFILKVDPKKRMLFNPEESIDFNGNTGPFIQYTYARIKSVLRKSEVTSYKLQVAGYILHEKEKGVIKLLHDFPKVISESAETYNPGHIANYVYELAKEYNQFYHECPIIKAEKEEEKNFRLMLSEKTSETIKSSLKLLGIDAPEKM